MKKTLTLCLFSIFICSNSFGYEEFLTDNPSAEITPYLRFKSKIYKNVTRSLKILKLLESIPDYNGPLTEDLEKSYSELQVAHSEMLDIFSNYHSSSFESSFCKMIDKLNTFSELHHTIIMDFDDNSSADTVDCQKTYPFATRTADILHSKTIPPVSSHWKKTISLKDWNSFL